MLNLNRIGKLALVISGCAFVAFLGVQNVASVDRSPASVGFREVDVSKADVVEMFDIPLEKRPLHKFEWTVSHRTYFRFSIQHRADAKSSWTTVQRIDRAADRSVWVTVMLNTEPGAGNGPNPYRIPVHFGFYDSSVKGWGALELQIPTPLGSPWTQIIAWKDPGQFLLLETDRGLYRLRLEQADQPFPENF